MSSARLHGPRLLCAVFPEARRLRGPGEQPGGCRRPVLQARDYPQATCHGHAKCLTQLQNGAARSMLAASWLG